MSAQCEHNRFQPIQSPLIIHHLHCDYDPQYCKSSQSLTKPISFFRDFPGFLLAAGTHHLQLLTLLQTILQPHEIVLHVLLVPRYLQFLYQLLQQGRTCHLRLFIVFELAFKLSLGSSQGKQGLLEVLVGEASPAFFLLVSLDEGVGCRGVC